MCVCYQHVFLILYIQRYVQHWHPFQTELSYNYAADMMADIDVGTLARYNYSCDPGFRLVGPQTRVCLLSMTWSDQPPVCQRK